MLNNLIESLTFNIFVFFLFFLIIIVFFNVQFCVLFSMYKYESISGFFAEMIYIISFYLRATKITWWFSNNSFDILSHSRLLLYVSSQDIFIFRIFNNISLFIKWSVNCSVIYFVVQYIRLCEHYHIFLLNEIDFTFRSRTIYFQFILYHINFHLSFNW